MAVSLREGASGSFSSSLFGDGDVSLVNREDARRISKAAHGRLHAEGATFTLPENPGRRFADLLSQHLSVGIFAGLASWFEVKDIETWLRVQSPNPLRTCYPRSTPDSFEYCSAESSELLVSPPFNIREPAHGLLTTQPSLIFVPCTLADTSGHRMGRGKGHFDRYLARHPGVIAVGVCHEDFLLEQFPAHWIQPHDQDMTALLTNRRFITNLNKGDLNT